MRYRPLGRTGVQVSAIGLGCMTFGWKTPRDDAIRLVAMATSRGINLFDTSNSYGRGESERVLGQAVRATGGRDRLLIATKFHFSADDDDPNARGNSRRHIIAQCEASLSRLGTDYIDLYQVHHPQPAIPIDETLRALDDLVRAGKVRYVGTSSFAAWQLVESLWVSKEYGLNRFVVEQPPYNLLERRAEWELFPMAQTYGFGILAFCPLAEGILTGKYRKGEAFPNGSRFAAATKPGLYGERLTDGVPRVLDVIGELAEAKGCSMGEIALAWVIRQPAVSAALLGANDISQLKINLGALEVDFSENDLQRLDDVSPPKTAVSPYYKSQFGPHLHRW